MNIKIIPMEESHWTTVSEIYKQGIETGHATFQIEVPTYTDWNISQLKTCRFVCLFNNQVIGWAALSPVSNRCVYGGVAEVSVYVNSEFKGKKIGTKLLEKLISESEKNGIWTLQAGIFPENKSSIRLHEKNGFRVVGIREKIGRMDDKWRDVILLERRSTRIGNE